MPNPSNASTVATTCSPSLATQQPSQRAHVLCSFLVMLAVAGVLGPVNIAFGQAAEAPAPAAPAQFAMADLRPALATVQNAITAANLGRWKIPGDVKANTQQDVASMQRDLSATLPGLMTTAETSQAASGPALAPTFAVFRNLDALYDVLLRVTEIANVGAPTNDAASLEAARAALEDGRGKLGAWLLQAISAQDAHIAQAAAAAARPQGPPPPPTKVVVDDGPENPKPRKKKPAATPAPQ